MEVHGGIISRPLELFAHDQAHNNDILTPAYDVLDNTYQQIADIVTTLAGRLYALISNTDTFEPNERTKAFRAASFLFHENQIFLSAKSLCRALFPWDNPLKELLKIIMQRSNMTLESYFSVVNSPQPPSTLSEEERNIREMMAKFQEPGIIQDSFYFHEKFASDLAKQICEIYPEATTEIFGTETDTDHNYVYHGPNALRWIKTMMNCFYGKDIERV